MKGSTSPVNATLPRGAVLPANAILPSDVSPRFRLALSEDTRNGGVVSLVARECLLWPSRRILGPDQPFAVVMMPPNGKPSAPLLVSVQTLKEIQDKPGLRVLPKSEAITTMKMAHSF